MHPSTKEFLHEVGESVRKCLVKALEVTYFEEDENVCPDIEQIGLALIDLREHIREVESKHR